ncbi:MAG: hypothetical protein M3R64_11235 [Pseudomonadota bacterium]|nr:hypothetical protein [Pseudomonadota bacterium]
MRTAVFVIALAIAGVFAFRLLLGIRAGRTNFRSHPADRLLNPRSYWLFLGMDVVSIAACLLIAALAAGVFSK